MNLEKGQYFRTNYKSKIDYVVDKFIDEDTGKLVYETINPSKDLNGNVDYYIEADKLTIYKASNDFYDILENKDLLLVYIDDVDYLTQLIKENNELVAYIKGKRYTLEDLKQLDAVNTIYGMLDLLKVGLNVRDLEEE